MLHERVANTLPHCIENESDWFKGNIVIISEIQNNYIYFSGKQLDIKLFLGFSIENIGKVSFSS